MTIKPMISLLQEPCQRQPRFHHRFLEEGEKNRHTTCTCNWMQLQTHTAAHVNLRLLHPLSPLTVWDASVARQAPKHPNTQWPKGACLKTRPRSPVQIAS
ncbi:hypothetical protein JZ751_000637 [Albula glossodonta]|uniref:Uncharacterized protein n=1 Tax=Albula glossodonta TaxID=121402 RepID=A0A8T2PWS0_9TELE|nr:hypothetical protein JZ751_000637 [Albula glossodonta]